MLAALLSHNVNGEEAQPVGAPPPPSTPFPPPADSPAPPFHPAQFYPAQSAQMSTGAAYARATPGQDLSPVYAFGATLATSYESEPGSTSFVFSPLLEGAYFLSPSALLHLTWGFGWLVDNQGLGESTTRVGNPAFGFVFRSEFGPWRMQGELGLTAPLAHLPLGPNGRLYAFVINQDMAMWGMWDQWLWSPDRMAVPARVRATHVFPGGNRLTAELALAESFGVRGNGDGAQVLAQVALEARVAISTSLALCPRLQTVSLPSASVDRLQSAASLRLIRQTRHGSYFAGVLFNLDEPLGIVRGLERWGLHLGKEMDL